METLGKLASGVAHEVNNPLGVIMQGVDYIAANTKTQDKNLRYAIDAINEAALRANLIINDLLNFSRISDIQMLPEDINVVINGSLLLLKNDIASSHVTITTDLDPNLPKIPMDKNRMIQVYINIVMNAIHAMSESKVKKLKIITRSRSAQNGRQIVVLKVEDTGMGLAKDVAEKMFEPFFTTKEIGKGTGLGLPIVKNIVESHNGSIRIENRNAVKGARVIIEFKV